MLRTLATSLLILGLMGPSTILGDQPNTESRTTLLLHDLTLIDGTGNPPRSGMSVLIEGDRILAIAPAADIDAARADSIINLQGRFLIPGLIEAHTHVSGVPDEGFIYALSKGLTTLRDMGGDGRYLLGVQAAARDGELAGPDVLFSAVMAGRCFMENDNRVKMATPECFELGEAPWAQIVEAGSDLPEIIASAKACGASGIKIYTGVPADLVAALVIEAEKQGMQTWAHSFVEPATASDVIAAGVKVISHGSGLLYPADWTLKSHGSMAFGPTGLESPVFAQMLKQMAHQGTVLDPTLTILDEMFKRHPDDPKAQGQWFAACEVVRRAREQGIVVIAGTDLPLPWTEDEPLPLWAELRFLVEAGLTSLEAINAATGASALALGLGETHGTIEQGKVANLVVLKADPTRDISNISQVQLVIKDGRPVPSPSKGRS